MMKSDELARGWIEAWIRMDIEWLREHLAEDFVHTSPLGRLEGRDHYLDTIVPMARQSVMKLEIKHVIADGDQAAIWFVNHTPHGPTDSCDWVRTRGDSILEIQSFYDASKVRESLQSDDLDQYGETR